MRKFKILGGGPADEERVPINQPDYRERHREQCFAWVHQLQRQFGIEPEGAELRVIPAGSGFTVVCYYELDNEKALAHAQRCRRDAWREWDTDAKLELCIWRQNPPITVETAS